MIEIEQCEPTTIIDKETYTNAELCQAYLCHTDAMYIRLTEQANIRDCDIASVYKEKQRIRTDRIIYPIVITPNMQTTAIWETSAIGLRQEITIICDQYGQKKKAMYIQDAQNTGNTALIPIEVTDLIIKTRRKDHISTTQIYKICEINKKEQYTIIELFLTISDQSEISLISYERTYQRYPQW